jgi:hydroxypyruvate reductase
MALAAAINLEGLHDTVFLSGGTDGIDGVTDAAGAIVDGGTCDRIRAAGMDPLQSIENNDSFSALAASDDLLMTGATGTNVLDVQLVLRSGDC